MPPQTVKAVRVERMGPGFVSIPAEKYQKIVNQALAPFRRLGFDRPDQWIEAGMRKRAVRYAVLCDLHTTGQLYPEE